MPGVITSMDNGEKNGSHTNHDREQRPNGINGETAISEKGMEKEKGKGKEAQPNRIPISSSGPNLNGMGGSQAAGVGNSVIPADLQERMDQLPPEIAHITQGLMPLSMLLTRFAQKTHNELAAKIMELAQMPLPNSAANGNAFHTSADDNSVDNVNKKKLLLEFAQKAHVDWTKAYIITSWSRHSEEVSKLIDLSVYLDQQGSEFVSAKHALGLVKRDMGAARMPNPDLKTAIQILSTGKAPWMPEFDYIPPPPLTAQGLFDTLENLNTLLSIRLNLHEHEKIPWHFRDFTIKSGRVTFKVAGEFEVDLGIADEDPESQFWFIDFRFTFLPSLSVLPLPAFKHLEDKVNVVLKDGLLGCYKLLHEMVLTHKISEFRKQALDLSRGRWIDALKVELLNRSLSIQYWADRYSKDGPKSWIILGVHSGKQTDGRSDAKTTSRLSIRWFRNAKEVKDAIIDIDSVSISTVSLMKGVIARHVNSILTSIFDKLQTSSVFKKREASIKLFTSKHEPAESNLRVQMTKSEHLTISIEPITGRFIFSPASPIIAHLEHRLNNNSKDPALDGHKYIEQLRAMMIVEDFTSRGITAGWIQEKAPPKITKDELQLRLSKYPLYSAWYRRASWLPNWWAVLQCGVDGERWFLVETIIEPSAKILVSFEMSITGAASASTYTFPSRLSTYAAALISHFVNLRTLHSMHAHHALQECNPTSRVKVPFILVRLSELLPSRNKSSRTKKAWARDSVKIVFQGLEPAAPEEFEDLAQQNQQVGPGEGAVIVTEARMIVPMPRALTILKERVDRDIAFDATSGIFAFRLRSKVGDTIIPTFVERAIRVERLVDFVEVLHNHAKTLHCESISLGRIIFTYVSDSIDAMDIDESKHKATIDFGATDTSMTLELERGNPHLRIADSLAKVLNEKEGLDGVATLLPLTLRALRALDTVEESWALLSAKGEAIVTVRAVEWYMIRYNIVVDDASTHKIGLEIRLQHRRGQPWWHVKRADKHSRESDDIDLLLKPVWNSSGAHWEGMRVSAVAQPAGIEDLIGQLDEVMRNFASGVVAPKEIPSAPTPVKPPNRAPEAPMMAVSQPRQQPTPNQSQSQSQGRNTPQAQGRTGFQGRPNQTSKQPGWKGEIVEID